MQVHRVLNNFERKSELRQAILHRAPGIPSRMLEHICNTVNWQRRYYIKSTSDRQRYLNLVTRETILTKDIRAITEVIPLYGNFQCPSFEKEGEERSIKAGQLDVLSPAAAVTMRIETKAQRTSVTYSLIIYLP